MAADGVCGDSVDQYRAEVERLTQELAEANREKIRAAECGLVVLEENQALKQRYADLEIDQDTLRKELEQLQEVREGSCCCASFFFLQAHCGVQVLAAPPQCVSTSHLSDVLFVALILTQRVSVESVEWETAGVLMFLGGFPAK